MYNTISINGYLLFNCKSINFVRPSEKSFYKWQGFVRESELFVAALFWVSFVLFSDKWRPFLLVSKHYFSH